MKMSTLAVQSLNPQFVQRLTAVIMRNEAKKMDEIFEELGVMTGNRKGVVRVYDELTTESVWNP